jgi:hypothetical protein
MMSESFPAPRQLPRTLNAHRRGLSTPRARSHANDRTRRIGIIRADTSRTRGTRSRTSQSFMHTSPSTEASELPHSRGKKRTTEEGDEAGRENGGIHSVVHYQFVPSCCRNGPLFVTRASKATSMSSTSRHERGIPLSSGPCFYHVSLSVPHVSIRA